MNVTRLVSFLLTGLCINYDVVQVARNTSIIKRETSAEESMTDQPDIPDDVCILAKDNQNALSGHHFTIATWEDWPTSYTTRDAKGRLVGRGTAFEFVEVLQEKFGFTYDVVLPADNDIGDRNRGLLGMLNHKSVDFVAAFLPMTPTLMQIASPSIALAETDFVVLMRRPDASATGSGLLAPFTTTVWILILVSLLAVGPTIFVIIQIRHRILRPKPLPPGIDPLSDTGEPIHEVYPLLSCMWFVYGALLKQGTTINAKSNPSRMLFATWWLFILVLTAYYTANLTAFLTLSKFTLPIENAEGIKKNGYRWFAEKGKLIQTSILNETLMDYLRPDMNRVSQYFLRINGTAEKDKILQKIEKGSVFLEERRKVEFLIFKEYLELTRRNISENKRCTLAMTPKSFLSQTLAFFYPMNSTLKRLFDPVLLHLTEAGIVKHRQRAYLPLNQICPLNLGSNERRLQNGDLFTTYMVIACGFVLGAIAFFGEHVHRLCSKRRGRNKSMTIDKVFGPEVSDSGRKRVRLKIPIQPRFPNNALQNMVVLPPGPTKPPPFEASFNMPFTHQSGPTHHNGHGHQNGHAPQNGHGPQNGQQYEHAHRNENSHTNVNGRDYIVLRAAGGATQLIPMRTPSALLFR